MVERKSMRRGALFLVVGIGFVFTVYNFLASTSWVGIISPEENHPRYHVALTATDAPYSQWQCRIMYYWYNKVRLVKMVNEATANIPGWG